MNRVYQKVVLVDDEAIQNKIHKMLIQRYLGRHYIEIVSFTNPAQAFLYLQDENSARLHTLVLLDLDMPTLTGWEFLDHLNHVDMDITTFYLVSPFLNLADIEKAYSYPKVTGCLIKPVDLAINGLLTDTLAALAVNDTPKP